MNYILFFLAVFALNASVMRALSYFDARKAHRRASALGEPAIGLRVRVRHAPSLDRTYVESMRGLRARFNGHIGHVRGRDGGHGVCFEVEFPTGQATYDLDELEVAP